MRTLPVLLVLLAAPAWADPAPAARKPAPPSPRQAYEARLRETPDQPAARMALARWCLAQGLKDEAREQCLAALARDPEFAEAREALGYRKVAGVWMSAEDARALEARKAKEAEPEGGVVEGKAVGWSPDHKTLLVEAKDRKLVNLNTRHVRVGIPRVTLELRPTISQLTGMRQVFTSGALTTAGQGQTGGFQQNIFIEAPITQLTSVRTTVEVDAYP